MKSVHLTSAHFSSFDSRIFYKECKSLKKAGYEVVLIETHSHDCTVEGVKIKAVPYPKDGKDRILNTTRKVFERALEEEEEGVVYHIHDFELIFYAIRLSLRGNKIIYDAHEDMPRLILMQHWIPAYLRPIVSLFVSFSEWIGTKFFWKIIAAEPVTAKRFPSNKTATVQNFPIKNELVTDDSINYKERPPAFSYIGGITEKRGAVEMIKAISLLAEKQSAQLMLAGKIYPADFKKELMKENGWKYTTFVGYKSRDGVAEILNNSRAGLVLLHPIRKYNESFPIKLFEYMSVGLPVIAARTPVMENIIRENNCGILVDSLSVEEICEAMNWILNNPDEACEMGQRGREAIEKKYCWEKEELKLLSLYKS